MGSYRVLLATLVILSHIGVTVGGHNPGVTAVVSFYLISGFVMTALIRKNYPQARSAGRFYLDRALRLFPQYLFYTAASLALVLIAKPASPYVSNLTFGKVLLGVLMAPLNFYMFGDLGTGMPLPQAWSLGLESLFYLAVPWLLAWRLRAPAFVLSVAVFLCAYAGRLDTDIWGYRLLPGTLFIFLAGSYMFRPDRIYPVVLPVGMIVAALTLLWYLRSRPTLQVPFSFEVLEGIAVGVPVVLVLSRLRSPSWDAWLGNLSYGMFLNHFFLIWLAEAVGQPVRSAIGICMLIVCSAALSATTYRFIERPVLDLRRELRRRVGAATPLELAA